MKTLVASLSMLVLRAAFAPSQVPAEPPFSAVQGAFFAVSVANVEASARWYAEKLGLKVTSQFPKQNKAAGALLVGSGVEVELIAHDDAVTPANATNPGAKVLTHGIFKAGFRVANFDQTVAALRARGVDIVAGPFPPRRDQRANVLIRDNAGNLIQVFGQFAP